LNVLINAISIKEGGSLVVVRKLISEFAKAKPDYTWFVAVCRENLLDNENLLSNVNVLIFPWAEKSAFHLWYWYEFIVSKLIKEIDISLLYSLTNYLPRKSLSIPTILLVQHAGHFSKEFDDLMIKDMSLLQRLLWSYKKMWVKQSIKNTNTLTVQTKSLANLINQAQLDISQISVISHGPGLDLNPKQNRCIDSEKPVLGYVTKYGVQKNFSVVLRSIKKLVLSGINPQLILTLNENSPEVKSILKEISDNGIEGNIINYGEVEQHKIQEIYNKIDIFLFPSIVESFGMPMLEAMSVGLPVIAAKTPVNQEILGENAILFSANSDKELSEKIMQLVNNPSSYASAASNSLDRIKYFSWESASKKNLALIDRTLNHTQVAG